MKIDEMKEQIAALQKKLQEEETKLKKFEELTLEKKVAILLHENLCHWNHTDGCSWYYYEDTNPIAWNAGSLRAEYLAKAKNVLNLLDFRLIEINDNYKFQFLEDLLRKMKGC